MEIIKKIDYRRVSNKLAALYSGPHKAENTFALWTREFKGILNMGQVKRLFDTFCGDDCYLIPRTPQRFMWNPKTANPSNWTPEWCENYFKKNEILKPFGPSKTKKVIKDLVNIPTIKSLKPSEEIIPVKANIPPVQSALSAFTLSELKTEIVRREEELRVKGELRAKHNRLKTELDEYRVLFKVNDLCALKHKIAEIADKCIALNTLEKANPFLVEKK